MNRKVKSFKQTVFLLKHSAVSKVTTSVRSAAFRPWHRPAIVLPIVYCLVNNALFEFSPEIRRSGVSSCYGNHAAASKPIKNVLLYQLRIEQHLCLPKW